MSQLPTAVPPEPRPAREIVRGGRQEIITRDQYPVLGSDAPDAIRLGRLVDRQANAITSRVVYGEERNLLMFGPNGTGKTMRFVVPNLLQCHNRSFFVLDLKGQAAAMTAEYRRTLGPVHIINPFGVMLDVPGYEDLTSCGYNPLAALDPHSPSFNVNAALFAQAVVAIEGNDPHWTTSARALVAALVMFVVMEARGVLPPRALELAGELPPVSGPPGIPTMARVRELLCMPSQEPSSHNEHKGAGIPALALAMMASGVPGLRNKAAQFTEWTNEIRSIASTAKIQTEAFDDPEIAADLEKNGVDFGTLKGRPTTVYLILPPDMVERHAKWLRLLITAAMQALMKPRRLGQPRTLFILDEFAALGHMEIIENVWAVVRDYGIQILPIFQDLNQLKTLYGQRWQTFLGNAGAIVSFTPGDLETGEWLSERAGETSRDVVTYSSNTTTSRGTSSNWHMQGGGGGSNNGISRSSSLSQNPTKTRMLHRHSLFGLQPGATLSFVAGLSDVVPGYMPAWWEITECINRARDNPYYLG